ncbi:MULTISPECIES: hypothetical protein [unclassified Roseovarius]|uniref:hypothetical protein n=1 Tax=unclassified Roseovarius TaxID=2614913 RepID=UPI001267F5FD|nr:MULTISPECIES: hypothetical protein [unclassified Roseovarius]
MPLITHDRTPSNVTLSIDALEAQLADMRADLEALYSQIREGKFEDLRNATRATSEIRQWLRIAIEAETQLEKRREKELGVAGAYALDLDEARESIGCRLARLRRARDAERVSGQPE